MKLWITKNSEVSVHDQLIAQVTLGIASNDLRPGERLPSTRSVARRFGVHQNTVSTAYRELAARGLVGSKRGSGVYVLGSDGKASSLDRMFAQFVDEALSRGFSVAQVHELMRKSLTGSAERYLLVEDVIPLREIVIAEIVAATGLQVDGISLGGLAKYSVAAGTRLVAMADEKISIETMYPDAECVYLKANSVSSAMAVAMRPSTNDLIAVVSGWESFISLARLYLVAARVNADAVMTLSTSSLGWKRSADKASMIICDSLTAAQFSSDPRVRVFPVVARSSLEQLNR